VSACCSRSLPCPLHVSKRWGACLENLGEVGQSLMGCFVRQESLSTLVTSAAGRGVSKRRAQEVLSLPIKNPAVPCCACSSMNMAPLKLVTVLSQSYIRART
jgi:hypothetical protein